MKLKRIITVMLALMLLLSACAKGKPTEQTGIPAAQTEPAVQQSTAADLSIDSQTKLIGQTTDLWQHSGRMYSVMDLDRNGRLEVLSSEIRENRTESHTDIYEVNAEGTGLDKLKFDLHPGEAEPAFITDYLQCVCENGTYYYTVGANELNSPLTHFQQVMHHIKQRTVRLNGALLFYST